MTLWTKIKYLLALAEKRETISESVEARVLERVMEKVARGHENRDKALRIHGEELAMIRKHLGI